MKIHFYFGHLIHMNSIECIDAFSFRTHWIFINQQYTLRVIELNQTEWVSWWFMVQILFNERCLILLWWLAIGLLTAGALPFLRWHFFGIYKSISYTTYMFDAIQWAKPSVFFSIGCNFLPSTLLSTWMQQLHMRRYRDNREHVRLQIQSISSIGRLFVPCMMRGIWLSMYVHKCSLFENFINRNDEIVFEKWISICRKKREYNKILL